MREISFMWLCQVVMNTNSLVLHIVLSNFYTTLGIH
jgi:hypothetical protein